MVMALRARVEGNPAPPASEAASDEPTEPVGAEADLGAASVAEIRQRLGEDETAEPVDDVIVDATEPVYSSEGAPAGEGRERSLRELFWGDE